MKKAIEPRQALRLLAHGPVLLLTTEYRRQPNIMTLAWSTPLSATEPLVGIAVAPTRLSHEFISHTDQFGLSVPHVDLVGKVHYCGSNSGREVDKWVRASLTPAEPSQIDVPLVDEALAWLECAVVNRLTVGDHTLFIAQILAAQAESAAFDEVWRPDNEAGRTLHFLGGNLFTSAEKIYRG